MEKIELNQEQEIQIGELYKSGISQSDLAKQFNVTKGIIRGIVRKLGLQGLDRKYVLSKKSATINRVNKLFTKEQEIEIGELYKSGASYTDLMNKYGFSKSYICKLIKKLGLNNLDRRSVTKEKNSSKDPYNKLFSDYKETQICEEYLNNPVCASDLAKKYSVNNSTILRILKRNGTNLKKNNEILEIREEKDYRNRVISLELEPKIGELYLGGASLTDISERLFISKQTISGCIRRLGLKNLNRSKVHKEKCIENGIERRKFDLDEEKTIIDLYLSGKSESELSKQYSCSKNTIKGILKSNNIQRRSLKEAILNFYEKNDNPRQILTKEQEQEVIKMYNNKIVSGEIAKKYNVSSHVVIACLERNNIPRRTISESCKLKDYTYLRGENNYNFQGLGKYAPDGVWTGYDSNGYLRRCVRDHPLMHKDKTISEHVYQACLKYGVEKVRGNHVHHINEIRDDNSWENLQIMTPEEHARHHDHLNRENWYVDKYIDKDFD
ncbi:MAG: HNH endonuclease [Nanoarchaeota archaeon]